MQYTNNPMQMQTCMHMCGIDRGGGAKSGKRLRECKERVKNHGFEKEWFKKTAVSKEMRKNTWF